MLNIDKILHQELTEGMKQRSLQPYSDANGFEMKVKCLNPFTNELFLLPVRWNSHRQKRELMTRTALIAHYGNMKAISVTADSRWVDSTEFCKHFGLEEPAQGHADRYQEQFQQILSNHGGDMANLPRQTWHEAIISWIKGPEIGTHSMFSRYVAGLNDRVQWQDTYLRPSGAQVRSTLIPDYWAEDFASQFTIPAEMRTMLEMIAAVVPAEAATEGGK